MVNRMSRNSQRQKLMTNLERCKRKLTDDPYCPLCHREVESILHTLRDCVYIRQYWRRIVPQVLLNTFFSSSAQDWLRHNLYSNILFRTNLPWKLVFSSILWHIWKNRNDAIFLGSSSTTFEQVLSRGIPWANYYNDGWMRGALVTQPITNPTPWSNPEPGWFCLNIDGVVSLNSGKATIEGLLRDNAGNFVFGYSKFIECVNSLHAELWSLYIGLQLAWDYGITISSIRNFWHRAWFIDLTWTPRSGNIAADKLARLANCSSFELSFFSSPPTELSDILSSDALLVTL
ncbi:hypothetical protein V6N11_026617 [Hibiscus sabdariffa]|uniref:RNase H type-1 domain-containing protein n=1 Tax=Hibiscus sabdariffa TaxID=183260 RepID=A0ABR2SWA1_9ROSI